jgi:flagellar biosynthesis/type III secretory pathway protein FliH
MARVIKGGAGGGARPARPAARVLAQAETKKVIDKDLFVARQAAEEILHAAEAERRALLAEGKRAAAQAREEAMVQGASTSFAQAAEEALEAFRKRADRYAEAADDIRALAHEIVRKVLGTEPDLGAGDVEGIMERGLAQLRARRRIRIQLPTGRIEQLRSERPNLMKAVAAEPDLVVEESDDVRMGFSRVVTEVGGALCTEASALDAVALAVNVRETPLRPEDRSNAMSLRSHPPEEPSMVGVPDDVALRPTDGTALPSTSQKPSPRSRSAPGNEHGTGPWPSSARNARHPGATDDAADESLLDKSLEELLGDVSFDNDGNHARSSDVGDALDEDLPDADVAFDEPSTFRLPTGRSEQGSPARAGVGPARRAVSLSSSDGSGVSVTGHRVARLDPGTGVSAVVGAVARPSSRPTGRSAMSSAQVEDEATVRRPSEPRTPRTASASTSTNTSVHANGRGAERIATAGDVNLPPKARERSANPEPSPELGDDLDLFSDSLGPRRR